MTKELRKEFEELIDMAWEEHDKALSEGDIQLALFWEEEALELVGKLPQNTLYLVKSDG